MVTIYVIEPDNQRGMSKSLWTIIKATLDMWGNKTEKLLRKCIYSRQFTFDTKG